MAMTEQEHKALRSYCAFILKQYGFQFSPTDPVIPALYVIHREMQLNNQNNKSIADLIKGVSEKINSKTYNFNSPGEAWKYQMAGALKWLITGGLIVLFLATAVWYWSMANEVEKAREIIEASERSAELIHRMKKDNDGYYFIEFKEAGGNTIQSFSEFEKINNKTIRIYLGKAND